MLTKMGNEQQNEMKHNAPMFCGRVKTQRKTESQFRSCVDRGVLKIREEKNSLRTKRKGSQSAAFQTETCKNKLRPKNFSSLVL